MSNIYKNTVSCILLHVSEELRHQEAVYTPVFKSHWSMIHYNGKAYFIILISAAEFQIVRSCKMWLKLCMLGVSLKFCRCLQNSFLFDVCTTVHH